MNSLQNLCISLIAEDFEKFYAFTRSNNENLQHYLKFLQRQYSHELGSELFKRNKLKNKYLNILLNEHLKTLEEEWIHKNPSYLSYEYSKKYIFRLLPNLTHISCINVDDDILKNIAKFFPKIVEISGKTSSATDQGIEYLCKKDSGSIPCANLKKLFIEGSQVTYKGVELLLQNLKCMEKLSCDNLPIALYFMHKKNLPELEKVPSYNLVELKLTVNGNEWQQYDLLPSCDDLLKICMLVCRKLKSLECFIVDEAQLSYLHNTCLENLKVVCLNKHISLDNFLKQCGCTLISLGVVNSIMSISNLLVSCPKLKHLIICNATFLDSHINSESVFYSLISLTISQHDFNKATEKEICLLLLSSPSLEEIRFRYCDVSFILKCCKDHRLKCITFMECVNIEINFIIDVLQHFSSLKTLKITPVSITDLNSLIQFAEMLPNKPRIHS